MRSLIFLAALWATPALSATAADCPVPHKYTISNWCVLNNLTGGLHQDIWFHYHSEVTKLDDDCHLDNKAVSLTTGMKNTAPRFACSNPLVNFNMDGSHFNMTHARMALYEQLSDICLANPNSTTKYEMRTEVDLSINCNRLDAKGSFECRLKDNHPAQASNWTHGAGIRPAKGK